MSFALLRSASFIRAAKRYLRRNPSAAVDLEITLARLAEDPFQPSLKSHRLKGELRGSWACSARYDLRVLFSFVRQGDGDAILLETVGTHDEVY